MHYVSDFDHTNQPENSHESAGAFRSSGLPDRFTDPLEDEIDAEELSRQCDAAEQSLAEQEAEDAIVSLFAMYGTPTAAGVIKRALDRATAKIINDKPVPTRLLADLKEVQ